MISIITSLYKSEIYLEKFLKQMELFNIKILNLSPNTTCEFIIICNDPSEKEKEVIAVARSKIKNLKIFSVPREPLYATWNRGLHTALGEVVGFWNVDDIRYPEAIVDGLSLIEQGNDLVYFPFRYKRYINILGFDFLVKNYIIKVPKFDRTKFTHSMICGPFFIFKKDFYEKVGPFDEQFKIAGDFDWCVRAAKIGKFARSNEVAGLFTNNGTSLSGSKNKLQKIENDCVYLKNK